MGRAATSHCLLLHGKTHLRRMLPLPLPAQPCAKIWRLFCMGLLRAVSSLPLPLRLSPSQPLSIQPVLRVRTTASGCLFLSPLLLDGLHCLDRCPACGTLLKLLLSGLSSCRCLRTSVFICRCVFRQPLLPLPAAARASAHYHRFNLCLLSKGRR